VVRWIVWQVNFDVKTMNLIANPAPELLSARTGTLASEKDVALVPNASHVVSGTGAGAAASADIVVNFTISGMASFGACVLSNGTAGGLGITINVDADQTAKVAVGSCSDAMANNLAALHTKAGANNVPLFEEQVVTLRILPDRSLADFFVQGGRWSGTVAWLGKAPRVAADSNVLIWAGTAGIKADIDVYGMGCGWTDPSYTTNPTM